MENRKKNGTILLDNKGGGMAFEKEDSSTPRYRLRYVRCFGLVSFVIASLWSRPLLDAMDLTYSLALVFRHLQDSTKFRPFLAPNISSVLIPPFRKSTPRSV